MINIQPIEKRVDSDGQFLDVHSIFYTIQGEGPLSGRAAVFIRLAGCNLQCPGCDTQYTEGRKTMDIHDICDEAYRQIDPDHNYHMPIAVITGGEPFRQNLTPLCNLLMTYLFDKQGFEVQIETNGTLPISFQLPSEVTIVCSPKTPIVHPSVGERAYFKYVLDANSIDSDDNLPIHVLGNNLLAKRVARPPSGNNRDIYVTPMDPGELPGSDEMGELSVQYHFNKQAVIDAAKFHGYIAQLQIHKLFQVE